MFPCIHLLPLRHPPLTHCRTYQVVLGSSGLFQVVLRCSCESSSWSCVGLHWFCGGSRRFEVVLICHRWFCGGCTHWGGSVPVPNPPPLPTVGRWVGGAKGRSDSRVPWPPFGPLIAATNEVVCRVTAASHGRCRPSH